MGQAYYLPKYNYINSIISTPALPMLYNNTNSINTSFNIPLFNSTLSTSSYNYRNTNLYNPIHSYSSNISTPVFPSFPSFPSFSTFTGFFKPIFNTISSFPTNILNTFNSGVKQVASKASSLVSTVSHTASSLISTISETATSLYNKWKNVNKHLSIGFFEKLNQVAKRIKCNANDLLAMMRSESSLNPAARNKSSHATGLIQFMPKTAAKLGTSIDALQRMSAEQQLDYVEKYYKNWRSSLKLNDNQQLDAGTLYAITFLPAFANKEVLARRGDKYYNSNKGLDVNKDGMITKSDLAQRVHSKWA